MRRTRSQIRAAEIAALVAEQKVYDKSVNEAMKVAAFARCDAVEQLYELLDVKPEQPITRTGKNGAYDVATDKDETKRSARLVEAVTELLSDTAMRNSQQTAVKAEGAPSFVHPQRQTTSDQQLVSAVTAQSAGLRPTG